MSLKKIDMNPERLNKNSQLVKIGIYEVHEHPDFGDEHSMLAKISNEVFDTGCFETADALDELGLRFR